MIHVYRSRTREITFISLKHSKVAGQRSEQKIFHSLKLPLNLKGVEMLLLWSLQEGFDTEVQFVEGQTVAMPELLKL